MKQITTNDGAIFRAVTDAGIVSKMRQDMWTAPDLKRDYMEQVGESVARQFGKIIRIDTPSAFLTDLASVGLIRFDDHRAERAV